MKIKKSFKRNLRLESIYRNRNTTLGLELIITLNAITQSVFNTYFNRSNLVGIYRKIKSQLTELNYFEDIKNEAIENRMRKIEEGLNLKVIRKGHHKNGLVKLAYSIQGKVLNSLFNSTFTNTDYTILHTNINSLQIHENFIINKTTKLFREIFRNILELKHKICIRRREIRLIVINAFAKLLPIETENFEKLLDSINYRDFFKRLSEIISCFNVRGRKHKYQRENITSEQFYGAINFALKRDASKLQSTPEIVRRRLSIPINSDDIYFPEECYVKLRALGKSYVLDGAHTYKNVFQYLKRAALSLLQWWYGYRWETVQVWHEYKDKKGAWREKLCKQRNLVQIPKEAAEVMRKLILDHRVDYFSLDTSILASFKLA